MLVRELPRTAIVEQEFPRPKVESYKRAIAQQFENGSQLFPGLEGKSVAVAVGSRGISNISKIVRNTVVELRNRGAEPFIVPAMGSHGGGTQRARRRY